MDKCMELESSNGTMAKFMKDNFKEENFMVLALCTIPMAKWLEEFGIEEKIYKCKKLK